jgi:uncharacterized protein (DUF305 family)
MRRPDLSFLALLLSLAGAGCATSERAQQPAPAAAGRSVEELEAIYHARMDSSRARHTDADAAFMTGMIAHHAQALVMAAMAPTHGAGPQVSILAARIDNAQRDEIRWMQHWLRDRGRPVPEVHIQGTTLMIHGAGEHGHHHEMPGMLTDAQLAELNAARDEDFDRLFLRYMIQHHAGAVQMVDELFATDGAAQEDDTFKVASDIQVDQRTEIARMQLMLQAAGGSSP